MFLSSFILFRYSGTSIVTTKRISHVHTHRQLTQTTSNWTKVNANADWSARNFHISVIHNNKMYVIGGGGLNDVWSSDNGGMNWTQVTAAADWSARSRQTGVVFYNKIYIMGGYSSSVYFNDVWSSDTGMNWDLVTDTAAWSGRHRHSSVAYDGKIYLMGGSDASNQFLHDVWSSVDGVTWLEATANAGWSARFGQSSIVFNNSMYVIGGYYGAYIKDVWSSTDGATWDLVTNSPSWAARRDYVAVAYNYKIYVICAYAATYLRDVWSSSDGGITWDDITPSTTQSDWTTRYGHSSVVTNNKLYILGGNYEVTPLNDIWVLDDSNMFPISNSNSTTNTESILGITWIGVHVGFVGLVAFKYLIN